MNDYLLFVTGPLPGAVLPASYNLWLVALSYVVASLAAYTAIDLAGQVQEFRANPGKAAAWLAGGAFSMGAGVWSMHFVAMLAYQLPIPVEYEIWTTLASMVAAILASGFALYIVTSGDLSWRRLLVGGVVMGAGIGIMHYTGMAAMRLDALVMYHIAPWLLSIVNAIVCSTIAIWLVFHLGGTRTRNQALAALVMGVAICGMHYTGMYATVCVSTASSAATAPGLNPPALAAAIGAVTLVIMSVALGFSVQSRAEVTVHKSEQRFRATFDSAPLGIMHTGIDDDRILHANAKLCGMLGYTHEELLGMTTDDFIHPDFVSRDRPKYRESMLKSEAGSFSSERLYVRKDGTTLWVNRTVSLARDASGKPLYFIRIIEDITERTQAVHRRAMEHAVTQVLAESASVDEAMPRILQTICQGLEWACGAYWKWNETAELLHCTQAWHVDAEGVAEFIAATKERPNEAPAWQGAAPGTDTGGVVRRVWFSGAPAWFRDVMQQPGFRRGLTAAKAGLHSAFGFPILSGAHPVGVMEFYSRDIRQPDEALLQMVRAIGNQIGQFLQRKSAEDRLAQLAQFDTITGLPNRYLFHDRLDQMLTQAQRNNWLIGTLFVDLDRFKAVNDTYGHDAGDKLLREVAARLKECVRGGDTVGRLSGDEFAVVLSNLAKADDAGLVAQKIVSALAAPFDLDGHRAYISASIGIALYPGDGGKPDTLIKNADTAMYRAKQQGRNGYQFYLPEMNERLMQRMQFEAHLRDALERGEYLLHYQPKVRLDTGVITGFEALLRWRHGDLTVSPADFIPILEDTGLIVPVGEWVLRSVCEQLKRWEQQGVTVRPVAVNLSARQFQRENLAAVVGRVLEETGVRPDLLELELTETLLMSDAEEAVQTLHQFKALGVRLSVDDFGTGYSSLAYLKSFPLDTLKIDRAFIHDAISNPDDAMLTITIINLAHSMKLKVVAEGVETEGQLNFLKSNGCDEMQGFYFSRPLPVEECTRALIDGRRLQYPQPGTTPESPSVLLVDDNEDELQLLKRALSDEGFNIRTADGVQAAFEILARHGADIVISDHHMPVMTGIEFLSRVRKLYPNAVRVVTSKGDDAPTITRATNKAGIHKFLSKTWDPQRLRAEVREAYQQRR